MKYIFAALILTLSLSTHVSAGGGGFDTSGLATEATLQKNEDLLEELLDTSEEATEAEISLTEKFTELDPIATETMVQTVRDTASERLEWANSSFQGGPTYVQNYDTYFGNIEDSVLRKNIDETDAIDDANSDDAITRLILRRRGEKEPASTALKSPLASVIKGDLCTEASISREAAETVGASQEEIDGDPDLQAEYEDERDRLAETCRDTTSKKNGDKALTDLFADDFTKGGWGAFLSLVGGGNTYRNSVAYNAKVADETDEALENERLALTSPGIIPEKKCLRELTTSGDCVEWQITTPASIQESIIEDATSVGQDLATSVLGTGYSSDVFAGLDSLLEGGLTDFQLTSLTDAVAGKGLNSLTVDSFDDLAGRFNIGELVDNTNISSFTSLYLQQPTGVNAATFDTNAPRTLSESEHTSMTKGMLAELNKYLASIDKLQATNVDYLRELGLYKSNLNSLNQCFSGQTSSSANVEKIQNARSFIANRLSLISGKETLITSERNASLIAKNKATLWRDNIQSSRNSSQIQTTYKEYRDAVDSGQLPSTSSEKTRSKDYKDTLKIITQDKTTSYKQYADLCNALR